MVVIYQFRTCNGFLEVKPVSINIVNDPGDDLCSAAVAYYADFTDPTLMKELWKDADEG